MTPFKVLWVVPGFPSSVSDPRFVFLREEAQALARSSDVELHILPLEGEPMAGRWTAHAATRQRGAAAAAAAAAFRGSIDGLVWRRPGTWLPIAEVIRSIDEVIGHIRPSVVHSHFAAPAGSAAQVVAHAHGAACVVSLRGYDVACVPEIDYGLRMYPTYATRLRRTLSAVDAVTVATSAMAEIACEAGARVHRVHVLPNAYHRLLDPPLPSPPTRNADTARKRAIVIGGLTRRKGFDIAIRAAAIGDVELIVVGDGQERQTLERLAENRAPGLVTFAGEIPPAELRSVLAGCDVFWSTARFEAFGNVILEAANANLPIVCTRQGVASDLVPALDRAEFFDGTPEDLVRKTLRSISSPALDRSNVLDEFDPQRRVARLRAIYREAIRQRST